MVPVLPPPYPPRLRLPVLAPSILSADFANLGTQVRATWRAGVRWLHLDIMDRHFVPNLTFGPPLIKSLRPVQPAMYFDAHIMVSNPWDHVDDLVTAGVQCICFHVEAAGDRTGELLADIRSRGLHGGLAIKPGTAVEALEPFLGQMDLALVMTVEPGFGGQALIPGCLEKVRHLRRIRSKAAGHRYLIQVDGGINMQTAGLASAAGADVLVAGNAVYNNSPLADNIRDLHAQIRSAQP